MISFYALKFPHARLKLALRLGGVPLRWFSLSAVWAFVLWIGLQLLGILQQLAGLSKVSAVADLGGAAAGVLVFFGRPSGP